MKNHSTKDNRATLVEEAIGIIYSSLSSHYGYTRRKSSEGKAFHIQAVQEYAKVIKILSELY